MRILNFKEGGEYNYNVTFETETEKKKISTNEAPKNDLAGAVAGVVVAALKYFRFDNITASFRQIGFSYPSSGPEGFVIELTIKTKENIYLTHSLKSEKLFLREDETASDNEDFQTRIDQSNALVGKVLTLRKEIEAYALGARMQEDLPFDDETDPENPELFEDDK
jgi:hypothetical protein